MFEWMRAHALKWLRVPHEPEPPFGAPGSVRAFRAGRNYYKLRLLRWGIGQIGAVVGIVFWIGFLSQIEPYVQESRMLREQAKAQAAAKAATPPPASPAPAEPTVSTTSEPAKKAKRPRRDPRREIAARVPTWAIYVAQIVEVLGIIAFLVQIPFTYALVRLEFEQHWYIVTDRSLRIRTGLMSMQESTMSFANIQQVEVKQGPLQRLLGLADLHVQSAGGGGDQLEAHGESLHRGVFRSVDNAQDIRDLILERLRVFRQAGLGDPEDRRDEAAALAPTVAVGNDDALAAAQAVLAEARALRTAIG